MSIFFEESTRTFFLDGKNVTYAFFINDFGYAEHLYFGRKIPRDDLRYTRAWGRLSCEARQKGFDPLNTVPSELSFYGTGDYRESAILAESKKGDRLSVLLYQGYEILKEKPEIKGMPSMSGKETLVIYLKDKVSAFSAELYYTVYDDADVIARHIVYKNNSRSDVTLHRAYSFSFGIPTGEYELLSLYGGWATERHIDRTTLHHGVTSIDSKRTSSSATLNPFIGIMTPNSTENSGEVYGFSLVYSSSFVLKAEKTTSGEILVTGGINDFDFSWHLKAEESFETPEVVIAYSNEGIGGMSRQFHDAFRNHLINKRYVNKERPVVINNWEATYFNFDNEKLMRIIDAAEKTGIDTFVLDDGWFGERNDANSSLGDWFVNTKKLSGGLKTVIDYVHSKGMKFGLWFEPEMISENSELYRTHPDYAVSVPGYSPCYGRNQFMLDLTRKDVRDYIVESVNKVLRENKIEYVKWDYNRNITESYSICLKPRQQMEFAHRYALGLYDICERIVNANPKIFFEGCSAGGARFDPAMLYYFPQIWTSDDTDAEERTQIQYGTSIVYPLSAMSCHVSVCPNHQTGRSTPMKTRTDIAHLGATGYELNIADMEKTELENIKTEVEEYKKCSDLMLNGDLYRIDDPNTSNYFTFSVVSKDKTKAVLLTYRRMGRPNSEVKRVKFQGLDENKKYLIEEKNIIISGATLMNVGMPINYPRGDFGTCKLYLKEFLE